MLASLRSRLRNDEDGFTLIELMVVVLIIAILIAIAIPTFLGVQNRAKDASAKSDLRNGITNAKAIATDNAGATDQATATNLGTAEPSLDFTAAGKGTIGVTPTADSVLLVTQSKSDTWFGMLLTSEGKVTSCSSKADDSDITAANCTGTDFDAITVTP
jgi:type IV pilus assembly protein PilA